MASAIDVARCLVRLAAGDEEPDYLTPLRLQKLLYYVQAWSLAQRNRPLFEEPVEASADGPEVRDVRRALPGSGPILPEMVGEDAVELDDEDIDFISRVWESYKGYSAWSPREMTRQESPWLEARESGGSEVPAGREISHESMKSYFTSEVVG